MTGSRRGPEPRISQEAVLAAARRLPRQHLTMRALGRELGVTHAALYRYFPDLKAVLAALGADLAETMAPASPDLPWQDWLRETALAIRRVIREHPEIGSPTTWPVTVPAAYRLISDGLAVLTRTFELADAVVALGLISRFAEGFARSELAQDRAAGAWSPELETLLTEVGSALGNGHDYDADAAFERELTIILAGIDATMPKQA